MALVVSQGLANGSRGGLAVASGIVVADLVLTGLVAAGVAAVLAAWPPFFDLLRYIGAAYLVWLAINSLRQRRTDGLPSTQTQSMTSIVRLSVITSLFNPKALLFFLLFLPQFVEPARGSVPFQLIVLGTVLTILAFIFHATLGTMSAMARNWADGQGPGIKWLARMQAAVFLGIALRLLVIEKPHGV